jgi:cytidyltransferase-like protein
MIIMVSGGFDPMHVGHLDMLEHAAKYGDVVVALNSDAWLIRKKGYCFMPYRERARLVAAIHGVVSVVPVDDSDGTVCEALRRIRPDFFANGGDRTAPNSAEHAVCVELGIREVFGVGGGKVQSSSKLVQDALHP